MKVLRAKRDIYMSWKQHGVFPIIFNTLVYLAKENNTWISHHNLSKYLAEEESLGDYDTVSNMVAWFSQKITEYEKGELSPRYKAYNIIQQAYRLFERKKDGEHYSYKLRYTPDNMSVQKASVVRYYTKPKKKLKQERFRAFVEYLKEIKIEPSLYRRLITVWNEHIGRKLELGN
jgi:hypothetical protein